MPSDTKLSPEEFAEHVVANWRLQLDIGTAEEPDAALVTVLARMLRERSVTLMPLPR